MRVYRDQRTRVKFGSKRVFQYYLETENNYKDAALLMMHYKPIH